MRDKLEDQPQEPSWEKTAAEMADHIKTFQPHTWNGMIDIMKEALDTHCRKEIEHTNERLQYWNDVKFDLENGQKEAAQKQ